MTPNPVAPDSSRWPGSGDLSGLSASRPRWRRCSVQRTIRSERLKSASLRDARRAACASSDRLSAQCAHAPMSGTPKAFLRAGSLLAPHPGDERRRAPANRRRARVIPMDDCARPPRASMVV